MLVLILAVGTSLFLNEASKNQMSTVGNNRAIPAGLFIPTPQNPNNAPHPSSADATQSGTGQQSSQETTPPTTQGTGGLSAIVKEWSPRVVRVYCDDQNYISEGSGVLTRMNLTINNADGSETTSNNSPALVTNDHVVTDSTTSNLYTACNFEVTGTDATYNLDMNNVLTFSSQDVAIVYPDKNPTNPGLPIAGQKTPMSLCQPTDTQIGDQVLILGYPVNGGTGQASTAITATQGIISSYDGEYYVTDAPIDHGNSGGAAILVKDDCYLGIPTWVQSGSFSSLGRILKASVFMH